MNESPKNRARSGRGRDVARLNVIQVRPLDQAMMSRSKLRDLTELLKRAGPTNMSRSAQSEEGKPELTSTSNVKPAAALPEPYLASEMEMVPTYVVGIGHAGTPVASMPSQMVQSFPRPYYDLRTADELYYYWEDLRGQRAIPLLGDLDRESIAISWPNTLLLSFGADRSHMPEITRLSRFTGTIEITSLVTEWIISSSRQAAQIGKALETERVFPGQQSPRRYQMMLLPFAGANELSNNVLCHLSCGK
jgi:hypothetical protein